MNRETGKQQQYDGSVPRRRGDEPRRVKLGICEIDRSPQARG